MNRRYYIGLKDGDRHLFYSDAPVTQEAYGILYNAVIGPFITKRAAVYMLQHGVNNPHLQTVNDAERISKHEQTRL